MGSAADTPLSVLVLDDDSELRASLGRVLEEKGYKVTLVADADEAIAAIQSSTFQLAISDLRLPKMDGMEFITKGRELSPQTAFILMTAFGDTDIAVQAIRCGAYDYIPKPFSGDDLLLTLRKVEERERLRNENFQLRAALTGKYSFSNIVAKSRSMLAVFDTIQRLSTFSTTVLVTGESGTGKELIARAIHESSTRKNKQFVAINCGAIPEHLMESELFGHRKGAFTDATKDKRGLFEEAQGGTIFLDEIGELPVHLQVKLLRALQEQQIRRVGDEQQIPIDIRIISATLRDLEEDVKNGRFREDLFYRLNVVAIHLAPLRDRPEDLPVLIEHFLEKHAKRLNLPQQTVPPDVMKALLTYPWPGNARELENCIERMIVLSPGEVVQLDALPDAVMKSATGEGGASHEVQSTDDGDKDENLSIKLRTKELEIRLIQRALNKTKRNRTHAAKILEISHRALLYKLKEYGIE